MLLAENHGGYQSGSEGLYLADEMISLGSVMATVADPECLVALSDIFVREAIIIEGLIEEFHSKVARGSDQGRHSMWMSKRGKMADVSMKQIGEAAPLVQIPIDMLIKRFHAY